MAQAIMGVSAQTFNFNTHNVRIVLRNGEPWFVAKDVCDTLGYANSRKALGDHLDADEKGVTTGDTLGGSQKLTIINESGLYALVLRSRKPEARKFAKWVTSEVLPAIRKTGSYTKNESQQTLNQIVNRLAEQLKTQGGYPVEIFIPLWQVINEKLVRGKV